MVPKATEKLPYWSQFTPLLLITQEIKAFPFKAKKKPNPGVCENPKFTHLSSVKIFPVVTSFPWGT